MSMLITKQITDNYAMTDVKSANKNLARLTNNGYPNPGKKDAIRNLCSIENPTILYMKQNSYLQIATIVAPKTRM